jgi:hypothetical protein
MNFLDGNNDDQLVSFTLVLPLTAIWNLHQQAKTRAKAGKMDIPTS